MSFQLPDDETFPLLRTERDRALRALDEGVFDVVIVGGGITGAALALVAAHARPRLRVALLERGDFAAGTSSRSSRLLHGGFRYLAHGRLALVRRLLRARQEWSELAPHLVTRAPFLVPWRAGPRGLALRAAGQAYALLGGGEAGGHAVDALDRAELVRREPLVEGAAWRGALAFDELAVHDARLVTASIRAARDAGVVVAARVACLGLSGEGPVTIAAREIVTGAEARVRARLVINAAGPWCDEVAPAGGAALRLSRGTHVVLPHARLPLRQTVAFFSPRDGRALFASPRTGFVLVGTTEVEHRGPADEARATEPEILYLLEALARAFPDARLARADVCAAFAGVRALAAGAHGDPGRLDRGYAIRWDGPGLLSIRGGKMTLALHGARQALEVARRSAAALGLPSFTAPGPGELPPLDRPADARRRLDLPASARQHLLASYGEAELTALAALLAARPGLATPIAPGLPFIAAERALAAHLDGARRWDDFAVRRSDLALRLSARSLPTAAPLPPRRTFTRSAA